MVRDYSEFLPGAKPAPQTSDPSELDRLGWQAFFSRQISVEELETHPPARIVEVHRSGFRALGDGIDLMLAPDAAIWIAGTMNWDIES